MVKQTRPTAIRGAPPLTDHHFWPEEFRNRIISGEWTGGEHAEQKAEGTCSELSLIDRINARLEMSNVSMEAFFYTHAIDVGKERVFLFILTATHEPVVLQDEYINFPSDKFIAALRVLL